MQARDARPGAFGAALLTLFIALYFYRLGAANIEAFLNYPFWRDMGPLMSNEDFVRLRADHIWKVAPLLVIPIGVLLLVTAILAFVGAPPVPRWIFLGALALQLVAAASTVLVQLPIQLQHNTSGYDLASFDRLIVSDFWLRKVPSFAEGALVLISLWRIIRR